MNRLAGYVFDSYDDVDGQILRSIAPSLDDLPDFVKTASRLSEEQIEKVSDDHFALVMFDQGVKLKKYAMVDRGSTAMSVAYLLKQAYLLPPLAVKIAAGNLIDACQHHGLAVPAQLKLAAETGVSPVSGKSQKAYAKNAKVSQIQFPTTEVPKESTTNPMLGRHDAGTSDVDQRTNLQGVQGSNFLEVPPFPQKEKQKTAGIEKTAFSHITPEQWSSLYEHPQVKAAVKKHGDAAHPEVDNIVYELAAKHHGYHEKTAGEFFPGGVKNIGKHLRVQKAVKASKASANAYRMQELDDETRRAMFRFNFEKDAAPEGAQVIEKQKSWRQVPYVDMSNWDPAQASAFESEPAKLTLLDGNYAVDGYDQVKTASAYFVENYRDFHPRQRHEYCVKLAARMDDLGIAQPDDVQRYGSSTYASDVDSYVEARRSYVHEEFKPSLDLLLEKRAQVSPETFAEALCEFDKIASINWNWGAQVADPWYSTFGPSLHKLAEENWHYDEEGTRITLENLQNLALNGQAELCKQFGKDFASEFSKNPKTVFNSMPKPNKKVLARMASQSHEGT